MAAEQGTIAPSTSDHLLNQVQTIPARTGQAILLLKGQTLKVINTAGTHCCDLWAFTKPINDAVASNTTSPPQPRYLSASHTRSTLFRLSPHVGDVLVTNTRAPILQLIEDTSPGVHDLFIAACDSKRYESLGAPGHPSCANNLLDALRTLRKTFRDEEIGFTTKGIGEGGFVPDPVNVFMKVSVTEDGALKIGASVSRKGDYVVLKAIVDCVVVISACPQDLLEGWIPMDIDYVVGVAQGSV